jgi:hypothetical protein
MSTTEARVASGVRVDNERKSATGGSRGPIGRPEGARPTTAASPFQRVRLRPVTREIQGGRFAASFGEELCHY